MSILNEQTFTDVRETRELIDYVVKASKESVCATMGPDGRLQVINNNGKPTVTKDGVSVAKALDFNEPRKNLIAKIIMEPSIKTDQEVGDGTTTTVFMMEAFYTSLKDRMSFRGIRYVDGLVERTRQILNDLVIPGDVQSERFRQMLMTTSNYETEIVDTVLKIYRDYEDPNILLKEAPTLPEDSVETNTQVYIPGAYATDEFLPRGNADGIRVAGTNKPYRVAVIDDHFSVIEGQSFAKFIMQDKDTPYQGDLIIFARNFDPTVINILKSQIQPLGITVVPYRIEAGGSLGSNIMRDLAEIIGTRTLTKLGDMTDADMKDFTTPMMITRNSIMFDRETNEHVNEICGGIVSELKARYDVLNVIDRQTPIGLSLMDRISRLSGSNIIIKVTGTVPSEAKERYYRFEDAIKAAKTGKIFGILPGIGWGYLTAAKLLKEEIIPENDFEKEYLDIFLDALCSPYRHLTGDQFFTPGSTPKFLDLVTGKESTTVDTVFDNAAATMTALSGGWSTAKTLGKLNNVMGRSMKSYI